MYDFITRNFVPVVGCLMMFAFVMKNDRLTRRRRRAFMVTLALFALSLFFRNADYITSNYEEFTIRRSVYSAFGYCTRAMMVYALLGTDLNLKRKRTRRIFVILGIPLIFTVFSAFSVFFTEKVYYFENNAFKSGPFSWLNYSALIIYLVVVCAIGILDVILKRFRHCTMIFGTMVLMSTAIAFEYFSFPPFLSECATTMALMVYMIFFQNSEFLSQNRQLKRQALIDGLTGLFNRTGYNELFAQLAKENDLMVGMLVLDIDHFKQINDTYGHDVGDRILKNVAKLLKVTFRATDFVIRYGGDEFVVIMVGITESLGFVVKNKIESINVQLENPISNIPKCSVSAGVAFSERGISEKLFKQADTALYQTKNTTKRSCTLYSELDEDDKVKADE